MNPNRTRILRALSLAALASALAVPGLARASSHREAPAIAYDPAADNTDVYAWVNKGTHDKLNIVANWIPFEEPSSGPNFFKFSDDVQYKIHLTRGSTSLDDVVTYTIRFKTQPIPRTDPATAPDGLAGVGGGKEFFAQITGDTKTTGGYIVQTYTVTKTTYGANAATTDIVTGAIAAPWRIGPNTQKTLNTLAPTLITSPNYDDAYAATFIKTGADGTRVFAGPRDDGFYVDLGGIFDLAKLRAKGVAQDGLSGYNVHSIALEIPTTQLTADGKAPATGSPGTASDANTLGVWASSSRKKISIARANGTTSAYGPWVQVSRLGIPLINEAVIGLQDKDKYNRTTPSTDVANFGAYFLNPVIVRDAEAVGIYAALGVDPTPFRHMRTDILDVINLKYACGTGQTAPCHNVPLTATGDVLRVDLGLDSGFPNGRSIPGGTGTNAANKEQADVTDVELTLLLAGIPGLSKNGGNGGPPMIQDGVDYNDKPFLMINGVNAFPWLALPWDGFAEGHGKPTP